MYADVDVENVYLGCLRLAVFLSTWVISPAVHWGTEWTRTITTSTAT